MKSLLVRNVPGSQLRGVRLLLGTTLESSPAFLRHGRKIVALGDSLDKSGSSHNRVGNIGRAQGYFPGNVFVVAWFKPGPIPLSRLSHRQADLLSLPEGKVSEIVR